MVNVTEFEIPVGESRNIDVDFVITASNLGVNAISVAWSVRSGTSATILGAPTITGNISTGMVVADNVTTGCTLIMVRATMTDGQTKSEFIQINVVDPTCQ